MLDCAAGTELGSQEHMAAFTRRAIDAHVPLNGAFDLTYRCGLRCVHCYCGHLVAQRPADAAEMPTATALRLLGEAADAGCMFLLLSGGDPLLHAGFARIYVEARRLGMVVSVFTNATLVTDEVADLLAEYPPRCVDVSVYGASAEVFDRVTGVPGSYRRAWRGIERLLARGVRVSLKTMILRDNLHEVALMERRAEELGLSFRLDPLVTPRLDGDLAPLRQRVEPEAAVALEYASRKRAEDLAAYEAREVALPPTARQYRCGAGVITFNLDPQGVLRPCLLSREHAFDAAAAGFQAAWRAASAAVADPRLPGDPECASCPHVHVCGYCAGLFALETGSAGRHNGYNCGLGVYRSAIISRLHK